MTSLLEYLNPGGGTTRPKIPEARAAHAGLVRRSTRKYGKPRISGNLSVYKAKAELLAMAASNPKPKRVWCSACRALVVAKGHKHTVKNSA